MTEGVRAPSPEEQAALQAVVQAAMEPFARAVGDLQKEVRDTRQEMAGATGELRGEMRQLTRAVEGQGRSIGDLRSEVGALSDLPRRVEKLERTLAPLPAKIQELAPLPGRVAELEKALSTRPQATPWASIMGVLAFFTTAAGKALIALIVILSVSGYGIYLAATSAGQKPPAVSTPLQK